MLVAVIAVGFIARGPRRSKLDDRLHDIEQRVQDAEAKARR
jgi:hypothetical protein